MGAESRRRIVADASVGDSDTKLELVRCDVAQLPLQDGSVDALHAGAAMHCWPELEEGLREIHRILKPNGGRFLASTFLSKYFRGLQSAEGNDSMAVEQQAFQYFESFDQLREYVMDAGFDKVEVEQLGAACAIIRAE